MTGCCWDAAWGRGPLGVKDRSGELSSERVDARDPPGSVEATQLHADAGQVDLRALDPGARRRLVDEQQRHHAVLGDLDRAGLDHLRTHDRVVLRRDVATSRVVVRSYSLLNGSAVSARVKFSCFTWPSVNRTGEMKRPPAARGSTNSTGPAGRKCH